MSCNIISVHLTTKASKEQWSFTKSFICIFICILLNLSAVEQIGEEKKRCSCVGEVSQTNDVGMVSHNQLCLHFNVQEPFSCCLPLSLPHHVVLIIRSCSLQLL